MATIELAKDDSIAEKVLDILTTTEYACTVLQQLTGGASAFTYRGILKVPIAESGASSVIIKHTEPYIALNPAWKLDVTRSDYEIAMLNALETKAPTDFADYRVKAPRTLLEPRPRTLLIEDLAGSRPLGAYLSDHETNESLDSKLMASLGFALGRWLNSFHQWGARDIPEMDRLRSMVSKNPMKKLKYDINIGRYLDSVDHFPDFEWAGREEYAQIDQRIRSETAEEASLIHGDWWTGNILLRDDALSDPATHHTSDVFIVDFEFSHLGCITQDLGQCFAELYLIYYFQKISAAALLITSISDGYYAGRTDGKSDKLAFQVAMHFGIHLVNWPWRVGKFKTSEMLPGCIKFGNECLLRGHRGDREWFRGGVLDALFA